MAAQERLSSVELYGIIIRPSAHQIHNKIKQYYCINICLLCTFAACFYPARISSGNFHEMYYKLLYFIFNVDPY
jgi:hypothetical protein